MNKEFTKQDLESGYVLETFKGDLLLYGFGRITKLKNGIRDDILESYNDTLEHDMFKSRNIIKIYKDYTLKEVLWERPLPILDDIEKEYLSNIIKPFRNRNVKISKHDTPNYSYIKFNLDSIYIPYKTSFDLPLFEKGTMYKGMETDKQYTLEELGL